MEDKDHITKFEPFLFETIFGAFLNSIFNLVFETVCKNNYLLQDLLKRGFPNKEFNTISVEIIFMGEFEICFNANEIVVSIKENKLHIEFKVQ